MNTSKIEFSFGTLRIQKNIVIGVMNEGISLDLEKFEQISIFLTNHFKDKSYGYISHRIHSYSIDPTVYMYVADKDILKAIAIVSNTPLTITNAEFEKQFLKQPLRAFNTLSEARNWLLEILLN